MSTDQEARKRAISEIKSIARGLFNRIPNQNRLPIHYKSLERLKKLADGLLSPVELDSINKESAQEAVNAERLQQETKREEEKQKQDLPQAKIHEEEYQGLNINTIRVRVLSKNYPHYTPEAVLPLERANQNRKTLIEWLESEVEKAENEGEAE